MSDTVMPSVAVTCADCRQVLGDQYKPGDAYQLAINHRNACQNKPVTFDSLGSPIYKHQLPPEEPSDER